MQEVRRNKFRSLYQPSKLLLGVIPDGYEYRFNVIALCFTMTCSYDPPMIAVSIEKKNYSYDLMKVASEFVLSVPGESLAKQAMDCGVLSGRKVDKFSLCNFTKQPLPNSEVPGIAEAIANIRLTVINRIVTGDHLTLIGGVEGYYVNPENIEKNLLAIGPNEKGYKLLVRKGLHRIAVIEGSNEDFLKSFNINKILS